MFRSLLPLWFRVSAWHHVGVGVVKEYIDNDVKVNLFLLLNPLFS